MKRYQTFALAGLVVILGPVCALGAVSDDGESSALATNQSGADQNPAFTITRDQVEAAIKRGENAAKRGWKLNSITDKVARKPKWVRGKKGTVHESRVWFYDLGGTSIELQAYQAAIKYEPLELPESLRKNGGALTDLAFEVLLTSIPKMPVVSSIGIVYSGYKAADEDDIRVDKFVLSDDKGHNFEAEVGSTSATDSSGVITEQGVSVVPRNREVVNGSATAYGSVSGPFGTTYGNAYAYGTATSTRYEYIPWSQDHPYFQARYYVRFSLRDKDGKPRIGPDVRKITLRILTANGEQDAFYDLPYTKQKR